MSLRVFAFLLLFCSALFASDVQFTISAPSGDRVSGVRVNVFRAADHSAAGTATSTGDGTAIIPGIADGDYQAVILAPGFAEQTLSFSVPQSQTVPVELKLTTTPQTVVVSAAATPVVALDTATSVDALNTPELTNMNPVDSSDALRYMPGAIVSSTGRRGNLASLFVRGGESNYNKVIIDGVPVNDPGGTFDFGVVSMSNIDRVEMVRSPESTIYGSDAMTSVVQLWTATGSTRTPEVQFGADGGTFSTAHGYASVAGARGIFDYNVFANQFNTQGQGVNDAYSNSVQGGNVGIRLSDLVSFRLRIRHYNSWTGIQNNWWFNGNAELPPDPNQYAHQNNFLASGDISIHGKGAWQHEISGFEYNHVAQNVNPVDDSDRPFDSIFNSLAKYNIAGFTYQGSYTPRPWAQTTFGYNFEDENGFIDDYSVSDGYPSTSNTHGLRRNNYLFGQEIINWKRLAGVAGLGFVNNESFGNKVVPRAAAAVLLFRGNELFSGTRLRGGFSEGVKEPSFEQSFGITGTFPTLPNPNLKPEETRALEAGVEQSMWNGRVYLTAVYFHNLFRNQIEYEYDSVNFTSQYVNFNRSFAQGAEAVLHGQLTNHLSLVGSYTYTSTQILEAPPCDPSQGCDPLIYGAGAPLLRRPKHAGTVMLNYSKQRWGAAVNAVAMSRRPDSDFLFGYIPPIYYAAGYASVDLGGWYNLTRHITGYGNIGNALNNHYNEVLGYPALKANFRAGVRFRFGGE